MRFVFLRRLYCCYRPRSAEMTMTCAYQYIRSKQERGAWRNPGHVGIVDYDIHRCGRSLPLVPRENLPVKEAPAAVDSCASCLSGSLGKARVLRPLSRSHSLRRRHRRGGGAWETRGIGGAGRGSETDTETNHGEGEPHVWRAWLIGQVSR